jgi:hypothetical protein
MSFSYPAIVSSSFGFIKSAVADGGPIVMDATCWGESFSEEMDPTTAPPSAFELKGATPNPFNPVTTIAFTMPQTARVKLAVFDVQGRLVATLIDGMREAGSHQVSFNGSNLASGVYLYRLEAGAYHAVGKMVLMK